MTDSQSDSVLRLIKCPRKRFVSVDQLVEIGRNFLNAISKSHALPPHDNRSNERDEQGYDPASHLG
jgi:hypothetical protein